VKIAAMGGTEEGCVDAPGGVHARLAALEAELPDVQARAIVAVAAARKRAHWLERRHLDLNELIIRRPGPKDLAAVARTIRFLARRATKRTRHGLR
jgi:hypothetical protein